MPTRFIVPQFIEEESRILGKITVRQFIILIVALVIEIIIFRLASMGFFLASLIFFGLPAVVIALVKINGQNFHIFLLNVLTTLKKPSLRVWNKNISDEEIRLKRQREKQLSKKEIKPKVKKEKLTESRLNELSLVVDTGGMYKGE